MALSDSFFNAVKIGFERSIAEEHAVTQDALKKLFNIAPNNKRQQSQDYIKSLPDADSLHDASADETIYKLIDGNGSDGRHKIQRPTPNSHMPDWRRRFTKGVGRQMNLLIPRAVAQTVGIDRQKQVDLFVKKLKEWCSVEDIYMKLELLRDDYREDANIAGFQHPSSNDDKGKLVEFPKRYINMFADEDPDIGNGDKNASPFLLENLGYLSGDIDEAVMNSATELAITKTTGIPKLKSKKVIIIGNTGYRSFLAVNKREISHKDYFGKDILVGGMLIKEAEDYTFLVLPDKFLKPFKQTVANGASLSDLKGKIVFPHPSVWDDRGTAILHAEFDGTAKDNDINASGSGEGWFNPNEMHEMIVLDPRAMVFFTNPKLDVNEGYKDQDKSLEQHQLVVKNLEGVRIWDAYVRRVFYTPRTATAGFTRTF